MNAHRPPLRVSLIAAAVVTCAVLGCAAPRNAASATRSPTPRAATAARSAPTIEQFSKIRAPNQPTLAPDGALYVRDWPDGVNQLYVRLAGFDRSAPMQRLTSFPDGIGGYWLSPDGSRIVVSAATGGNEQYQLYLLSVATGKVTPILQNPDVVYRFNVWMRDGSGFVYAANDQSPSDFHLYRYDLASGRSEKLLADRGSWSAVDVTDDGSRLLVSHDMSVSDSRVLELQASTHELKDLSVGPSPTANEPVGYMPGEKEVLVISDVEDGVMKLFAKDIASGAARKPAAGLDPHEIDNATINRARDLLAVTVNRDGFADLSLFALPAFKPVASPLVEEGVVGSVDIQGKTVVYTLSNARTPGVAYAYGLGEVAPRQITTAETQGVDLSTFTLPRLVRYRSFDGREIPAFLFTPPGFRTGAPIPFVVNYHGGPEGQHRPGFNAVNQYLLSRGYGVLMPNVRGSTGYGRAYHELDNYKNRWDSVKDGVEAARWLVKSGYARAGRIAAYGGSYGGFMAVATVVEDGASPDPVFGASVDVVGIVNMRTFLEQTKDYRRKLREVEYGPLSDPEFLESISPIKRVDQIKVPMLIAHGLNDPRVPVGEAMQLAVALQRRGLDPELLFFPDEGHGFAKLDNRLLFYEVMARFLDRTIGG